jgi:hypothetical protein
VSDTARKDSAQTLRFEIPKGGEVRVSDVQRQDSVADVLVVMPPQGPATLQPHSAADEPPIILQIQSAPTLAIDFPTDYAPSRTLHDTTLSRLPESK